MIPEEKVLEKFLGALVWLEQSRKGARKSLEFETSRSRILEEETGAAQRGSNSLEVRQGWAHPGHQRKADRPPAREC